MEPDVHLERADHALRVHVQVPTTLADREAEHREKGDHAFFFSSRRRHTRLQGDWSSDVFSSDLIPSTSELESLVFVCPSKRGSGTLTETTATRPSRTSSPVIAGSFSLMMLLPFAKLLMTRVRAVRKPERCVPPSRL